MNVHRFYCPQLTAPRAQITGPQARHICSVLRLKCGQMLELFDGKGILAQAVIAELSPKQVTLEVKQLQTHAGPKRPAIVIAAAVAKQDRFDWLIAKCTELGVDRITPLIFDRSVKQPKNPKIIDRWNNIAVAAAKQCKRLHLPAIDLPVPLTEVIKNLTADYLDARILVGSLADNAKPLIQTEFNRKPVIAFIGPEGGLTDREQNLLNQIAAQPVRITDTILRVETAAIAFAALLTALRDALP